MLIAPLKACSPLSSLDQSVILLLKLQSSHLVSCRSIVTHRSKISNESFIAGLSNSFRTVKLGNWNAIPYLSNRLGIVFFAEIYFCTIIQTDHFSMEINCVKFNQPLPKGNCLLPLSALLDLDGLLRVGVRQDTLNYHIQECIQ